MLSAKGSRISRPTFDEVLYYLLFGFREGTYEALNRFEHDAPLRFGLQRAERIKFQLQIRWNSNTELWVIRHLFTRASPRRWPPTALALSSMSLSHAP